MWRAWIDKIRDDFWFLLAFVITEPRPPAPPFDPESAGFGYEDALLSLSDADFENDADGTEIASEVDGYDLDAMQDHIDSHYFNDCDII